MRLNLIAGNLVIVLLVGLGSYLVVRTQLRAELSRKLEDGIGDDSELFARSWRADGARLAEGVSNRASSQSVRNVFTALGEAGRRSRAYEAAQDASKWFQDPARGRGGRPHIVAVIDETGRVIARDTDRNRMFGEPLVGQGEPRARGQDGLPEQRFCTRAFYDILVPQTRLANRREARPLSRTPPLGRRSSVSMRATHEHVGRE